MIHGTPFFDDGVYVDEPNYSDIDVIEIAHEEGREVNVYTLRTCGIRQNNWPQQASTAWLPTTLGCFLQATRTVATPMGVRTDGEVPALWRVRYRELRSSVRTRRRARSVRLSTL